MTHTSEYLSFRDELRLGSRRGTDRLDAAGEAIRLATEPMTGLRQERDLAREDTRQAARLILRGLCERDETPLLRRAAWSAAYHSQYARFAEEPESEWEHSDQFAAAAEAIYDKLLTVDEALRQPGASILRIVLDGPEPTTRIEQLQTTYGYAQSDGTGLQVFQHQNDFSGIYGHTLTAGQRQIKNRAMPGGPKWMTPDERWHDMINGMSVQAFAAGLMPPITLANRLMQREELLRQPQFVVGDEALNQFFNAASGDKADMILGHAMRRGFRFIPADIYEK